MARMIITLGQLRKVLETEQIRYPITFMGGVDKKEAHAVLKNSNKKKA